MPARLKLADALSDWCFLEAAVAGTDRFKWRALVNKKFFGTKIACLICLSCSFYAVGAWADEPWATEDRPRQMATFSNSEEESTWMKVGNSFKSGFKKLSDSMKLSSTRTETVDPISLKSKVRPGADLHLALGQSHEENNEIQDARKSYEKAYEMAPKDKRVLLGYARFLNRYGDLENALELYKKAAKIHPDQADVFNDMALFCAENNMEEKAVEAFREAVRLEPTRNAYRNNMATVLVRMGQNREAFTQLRAMSDEATAFYNLGFLLQQQGRKSEAIRHFKIALTNDPDHRESAIWLSHLQQDSASRSAIPSQRSVQQGVATNRPVNRPMNVKVENPGRSLGQPISTIPAANQFSNPNILAISEPEEQLPTAQLPPNQVASGLIRQPAGHFRPSAPNVPPVSHMDRMNPVESVSSRSLVEAIQRRSAGPAAPGPNDIPNVGPNHLVSQPYLGSLPPVAPVTKPVSPSNAKIMNDPKLVTSPALVGSIQAKTAPTLSRPVNPYASAPIQMQKLPPVDGSESRVAFQQNRPESQNNRLVSRLSDASVAGRPSLTSPSQPTNYSDNKIPAIPREMIPAPPIGGPARYY
jgi:tetratricopeptide (TPR) repeat protein